MNSNYDLRINNVLDGINILNQRINNKANEVKQNIVVGKVNNMSTDKCKPLIELTYREHQINKKKNENPKNLEKNLLDIDDINKFLDKEHDNIYNRPWNKLELSIKRNRLLKYLDVIKLEYNLDAEKIKEFTNIFIKELEFNNLDKKSDVDYDIEKGEIIKIKKLVITNDDNDNIILFFENKKLKKDNKLNSSVANNMISRIKKLEISKQNKLKMEYNTQKKILGIE